MGTTPAKPREARRAIGASLAATILAALASQHHLLHMILLAFGVGGTGLGFLTIYPTLRRVMLILSVVMLGFTVYRALSQPPPAAGRLLIGLSVIATLGFVAWSVVRFGL